MQLITLDFETYYDAHYTLKQSKYQHSTSEYVRSPLFRAHGVGVKINDEPSFWVSHDDIPDWVATIDWDDTTVLAHHAQFDGFILSEVYGVHPANYACTLSISRAVHQGLINNELGTIATFYGLGEKGEELKTVKGVRELDAEQEAHIRGYCINDVELTYAFYMMSRNQLVDFEHDLIDLTIKLFVEPVLQVNTPRALAEKEREIERKRLLLESCGASKEELASNQKFAALLESKGVTVPMKLNPKGKSTFAFAKTDLGFMQIAADHPHLKPLVDARVAVKSTITTTRAQRLVDHCPEGRALPIYLLYWGAHTGRWSGGDKMNPQNFTRGSELRKSVIAPDGKHIVVVDLSQIEARMLAWWARATALLQAFAEGRDIYSEYATEIYGYPVNRKSKNEQGEYIQFIEGFVGKVAVLGLGYSMGAPKFQLTLAMGSMGPPVNIDLGMAYRIVNLYRGKNPEVTALWGQCGNMLTAMCSPKQTGSSMFASTSQEEWEINGIVFRRGEDGGEVVLPTGRVLKYPGLHQNSSGEFHYRDGYQVKKIYGALLVENIVQAMARDVIAQQMLTISQRYKVVLSTHDEVCFLADIDDADAAYEWALQVMTQTVDWCPDLPLAAEGGHAEEYSK